MIIIKDCKDVSVHHFIKFYNIRGRLFYDSLKGINILGNFDFCHILCLQMSFQYDKNGTKVENKHQNLFIDHAMKINTIYVYKDYLPKYVCKISLKVNSVATYQTQVT